MKKLLLVPLLASLSAPVSAQPVTLLDQWNEDRSVVVDALDVDLEALKWRARAVIVLANSPFDPLFIQQVDLLARGAEELAQRDVIVITDTNPDTPSDLRLKLRPRAFMMVLIGKDGQIKLRKPAPWDVREISRSIDKTPLRQQEVRDRRLLNE